MSIVVNEAMQPRVMDLIKVLRIATREVEDPLSLKIKKDYGNNPFLLMISCLLSLRARDVVTYPVCLKLFAVARTPAELRAIPTPVLEEILHPIGFFRRKAQIIKTVSAQLIERFHGSVPATEEELLSLPGVGRKTANLVLAEAFDVPAICVDTHIHQLSNKLGLVATKTPQETERALQKIVPKRYWIEFHQLLIKLGQQRKAVCRAVPPGKISLLSPVCSTP